MRRLASIAVNLGLVVLSAVLGLALLEFAFRVYPEAFPDNLRALIETDDASRHTRKAVVEKLPHSPFAKPYANVDVFIPGYYGPKDTFVYEWRSDRRGFKNLPETAARDQVDIVAVGDSFTEGMGVATEDTWASRLSRKGHPTYSLGIQGYAPTQLLGAYEHYGRSLQPKWVIIGLVGNFHRREGRFLEERNSENWSNRSSPEAIGRLQERDEMNRHRPIYLETKEGYRFPLVITQRHRFLTTAVIELAQQRRVFARTFDIKAGVADPENDPRFSTAPGKLSLYRTEVLAMARIDSNELTKSPDWIASLRTIERIATVAKSDGARVLLVLFPTRSAAYWKRLTGRDLPPDAAEVVQSALLRAFAAQIGLSFLDVTPAFEQEAANMIESRPETYPYLKIDGHPSARGHEIIATEIDRFFKAMP
jgi:hypothetical protein